MSTLTVFLFALALGIFIGWLIAEWEQDTLSTAQHTATIVSKDDELDRCHALITELQADNDVLCRSVSDKDGHLFIHWT